MEISWRNLLLKITQLPPQSVYIGGEFRCSAETPTTDIAMAFKIPGGWQAEQDAIDCPSVSHGRWWLFSFHVLGFGEKGSDDEFEPPAALKGGKKKASPAAKLAAAAPRKRGPAKKQTLITDTLKPAENIGISPEKKVRRIRQSPFNKKSSSVMGRVGEGSSSEMMMKSDNQ
ncbi:hypothetical protein MKW98_025191 [Papaver atlanticum]|uniref:Uncharacterized protein n=1 Tax=Papaver atlanticum TaxID=357466 RepID=A0AAD4X7P5_9MAGN|nr:hypothetical protein MKW98_025191 [Papaver atlanticum]